MSGADKEAFAPTKLHEDDQDRDASYEVGRGRPPIATRFQKGQSGNPRGRPKKAAPTPPRFGDGHVARSFEKAALKSLKVNEGGLPVKMTVSEAIQHKMVAMALGGNRLLLQHLDRRTREEEERARQEAAEEYQFWRTYKVDKEALIARAHADHKPAPHPLPHPADILLDPAKGTVHFLGPISPASARPYDYHQSFCELMVGLAERDRRQRRLRQLPAGELCMFELLASLLHRLLPPSYGGDDPDALIPTKMEWQSLGKAQLARRIGHLQQKLRSSTVLTAEDPLRARREQHEPIYAALDNVTDLMLGVAELQMRNAAIDDAAIETLVKQVIRSASANRASA